MVDEGRLVAVGEAASTDTFQQRRGRQEDGCRCALLRAFLQVERGPDRPPDVALEVGLDRARVERIRVDPVLAPACCRLDSEQDDGSLRLPVASRGSYGRKRKLMSSNTTGENRCPLEDTETIRAPLGAANAGWRPSASAK